LRDPLRRAEGDDEHLGAEFAEFVVAPVHLAEVRLAGDSGEMP
jgi:hypothetical protein